MQNANGHDFDLAITGMACRFPGADSLEAFWQNLCQGKETLTVFNDEALLAAGVDPETLQQPGYVKSRGILTDIDAFDANFFGYSPREAELMDPQQRVFLECAWQAFEHANCNVQTYQGRVGVFAGSALSSYLLTNLFPIYGPAVLSTRAVMVGNEKDYLPARVSYKLNLSGPSVSVNTTCSTALVAVHLACQSLLHGECDLALAGGISLALPQVQGYVTEEEGHLSPDGHCRAFDARANGFVPSNGVGVVILKRLSDALADRDCIHAVIKGSAVNNDGAAKVGFTTPGVEGQTAVVIEALTMAGCEAETISYVETHGTGTDLGDSLEIAALTRAFQASTSRRQFCAIGSVKPNIGHTGTASGMASLIKAVMALKHRQIPPSLYFEQPNPNIDFARSPFKVNTALTAWQDAAQPRRAAVHSFGNGGTNAHVILEEAPGPDEADKDERGAHLLVLSARTASALDEQSRRLAEHLSAHPDLALADLAFTLQTSRACMKHRRALVCRSREEAIQALHSKQPELVGNGAVESEDPPVIFVFPEAQPAPGLGYALYKSEPVYRKHIDECVHFIRSTLGTDIRDLLYDETGSQHAASMLKKASIAGPALFM
ncbi:MAG TPA: type I polyketide synthase, partial [Ktedonobacteraceae bacterium]|nr:type I polyketide synthase [Ktedonobacteraceae bacterium]